MAADGWAEVLLPPAVNDDEKPAKFPLLVHAWVFVRYSETLKLGFMWSTFLYIGL